MLFISYSSGICQLAQPIDCCRFARTNLIVPEIQALSLKILSEAWIVALAAVLQTVPERGNSGFEISHLHPWSTVLCSFHPSTLGFNSIIRISQTDSNSQGGNNTRVRFRNQSEPARNPS